ncbi:hypothetical protein HPQ64_02875 [Rhizobiales bacterium]|uniref:hypothetical protein n=1 Tax=Hongsoonwoonella zoysiae TaxID=2821844 RepID=UPI0015611618|nr:hypothetical protein [Hongsoonwoonella zoysiae]NRG16628.1 hypothetical protein [Hongsoonwoonella zoysiae]
MNETGADGEVVRTPLAAGLSLIASRLGVRRSAQTLLSGIPLTEEGDLPVSRLADAAARAGLTVLEVELSRLTPLDVPAIAIGDGGGIEVIADIVPGGEDASLPASFWAMTVKSISKRIAKGFPERCTPFPWRSRGLPHWVRRWRRFRSAA